MTSQGGKPSELARRGKCPACGAVVTLHTKLGDKSWWFDAHPGRKTVLCRLGDARCFSAELVSDRELSSAGVFVPVDREKALMEHALRVIAHVPGYDGRFCMDREDCPNCYAQGTLAAIAEARAAQSKGGGRGE